MIFDKTSNLFKYNLRTALLKVNREYDFTESQLLTHPLMQKTFGKKLVIPKFLVQEAWQQLNPHLQQKGVVIDLTRGSRLDDQQARLLVGVSVAVVRFALKEHKNDPAVKNMATVINPCLRAVENWAQGKNNGAKIETLYQNHRGVLNNAPHVCDLVRLSMFNCRYLDAEWRKNNKRTEAEANVYWESGAEGMVSILCPQTAITLVDATVGKAEQVWQTRQDHITEVAKNALAALN